jgi:hypothetical protein
MSRPATAAELARHREALAQLRADLFRDQTPAECHIYMGSEKVLPPYVHDLVNTGRRVSFGGLEWRVASTDPKLHYEVSVEHDSRDDWKIFLVIVGEIQRYTRFAAGRKYTQLPKAFRQAIESARGEDAQFLGRRA